MSNYQSVIRQELANNSGKVYREESRAYWRAGASDAWDDAPDYDVDQSDSFWGQDDEDEDDEMNCMFF